MTDTLTLKITKRRVIQGIILAGLLLMGFCAVHVQQDNNPSAPISSTEQTPIPTGASCTSMPATVPMTEGPYFKPNSPERDSLFEEGSITGTRLTLSGYVFGTDCKPLAHVMLNFWQANAEGQYDNAGFSLRGHQFTDADGHYQLITIIPGLYPGRTEHIHVKVQVAGGPVLTTQLFFPGVSENESDSIFDPTLVLPIEDSRAGKMATFNFVIDTH